MITDKSVVKTEAVFSDDRQHRYLLKKEWDKNKKKGDGADGQSQLRRWYVG